MGLLSSLRETLQLAVVAGYVTCTNLRRNRNNLPSSGALPGLEASLGLEESARGGDVALSGPAIWASYRTYLLVDCQRAARTVTAYRYIIWDFFGFLDPKPWNKATAKDLQRFLDRPTRSGRAHGQRLAPNTRLHYAATVCGMYAWAHKAGYLTRNPMAAVKLPKGGQPQARSFSQWELRQILLAAEPDPRLYVMCWLGYGEGCRCGEIAACLIEDIDLYGRPPRLLVHGKGGRDRLLPIFPEVRAAVVRMLSARGNPRVGPLVESRRQTGEPMTPGSVSRALSEHVRGLGIDGSGHGLRHSFATELLAAAGEERAWTIAKLMGHADTKLLMRLYALKFLGEPDRVLAFLPDPRRIPNPRPPGRPLLSHLEEGDPRQPRPRGVGR